MDLIKASFVIEILGRPAEHIQQGMNSLLERIAAEKGVTLTAKTIHDPHRVEEKNFSSDQKETEKEQSNGASQELWTTFAEVELQVDTLLTLYGLMFAYMPSHVEIIYPQKLTVTNREISEVCTKLISRLHEYDAIAKNALMERDIIRNKLFEVAPHLFKKREASAE